MKSYTDTKQSKKLAEFLPLESADMFCADVFDKEKESHSYNFHILSTWGCNTFEELKDRENKLVHFIPCWSLAALFGVLPYGTRLLKSTTDDTYHCDCPKGNIGKWFDNPIDACVEMILKLHEQKFL